MLETMSITGTPEDTAWAHIQSATWTFEKGGTHQCVPVLSPAAWKSPGEFGGIRSGLADLQVSRVSVR